MRALRARDDLEVVCVRQRRRLRPGGAGRRRNPLRSAANLALDSAWTRVGLPRAARRAGADVLHHPLPAHSPGAGCAQVVTVHDVAFERHPEEFDPAWRAVARRRAPRGGRAGRRRGVPVAGHRARRRRAAGRRPERTVVAPTGRARTSPSRPRPRAAALPLPGLRRAAQASRVAGGGPRRARGHARAGAGRRGGPASGAPGTQRRARPLAGARWPSCWPARWRWSTPRRWRASASRCWRRWRPGCPVVALRSPSSEEVCGDAALLVAPGELAATLRRVADDDELRERLAAAAASAPRPSPGSAAPSCTPRPTGWRSDRDPRRVRARRADRGLARRAELLPQPAGRDPGRRGHAHRARALRGPRLRPLRAGRLPRRRAAHRADARPRHHRLGRAHRLARGRGLRPAAGAAAGARRRRGDVALRPPRAVHRRALGRPGCPTSSTAGCPTSSGAPCGTGATPSTGRWPTSPTTCSPAAWPGSRTCSTCGLARAGRRACCASSSPRPRRVAARRRGAALAVRAAGALPVPAQPVLGAQEPRAGDRGAAAPARARGCAWSPPACPSTAATPSTSTS